jgi:antitoxin (DNA-binding transcriptional repressor) of toxin-antitoxin stability system
MGWSRTLAVVHSTCLLYNETMAITASDFRKNLFRLLDRAIRGEPVDVEYKGVRLKVSALSPTTTKRSRLKKRDILLVPPDDIVSSDTAEMEREWDQEDQELGS